MMYSCTYHPEDEAFLVLYRNYKRIACNDNANAAVIRFFELKTNKRITAIRQRYRLSEQDTPEDALLWIDENQATLREIANDTQDVRCKSTLARTLNVRNSGNTPKSLLQLGYLKCRYIARYPDHLWPHEVFTQIHEDERGFFVVVDEEGYYQANDGTRHNARAEGYARPVRQYLYCFEKVNAAIAALYGRKLPMAERWKVMPASSPTDCSGFLELTGTRGDTQMADATQRGYFDSASPFDASSQEHSTDNLPLSTISRTNPCPILDNSVQHAATSTNTMQSCPNLDAQPSKFGRYINKNLEEKEKKNQRKTKKESAVSLSSPSINFENLRQAPWTVETVLALMARHLPVPPRPDPSDKAAMERYLTIWYEPTLFMVNETCDLEPARAWAESERRIVAALRGPTWQAKHRVAQGVQLTARDIVGPADPTKPLTGKTWHILWSEAEKERWWPDEMTRYDGPPLEILAYQAGYTGVQSVEATPEPPVIVEPPEIPAAPAWMTQAQATDLFNEIWDQSGITAALTPLDGISDRWYTSVQYGPDPENDWYHFETPDAWRLPTPEAIDAIEAARRYAALQNETYDQGAPDSGGGHADPELPPIIIEAEPEPLESDARSDGYLSVEALTLELQGKTPISSAALVSINVSEPIIDELAVTSKTGVSWQIATMWLKRVVEQGYQAELVPLPGGRGYLRVETSPGVHEDFETAVAWSEWRKATRASPGSIAAVLSAQTQPPRTQVVS